MMFQLASSDGSTGPRAFSIKAGSASVLSPNSASTPPAPVAVPLSVAPVAVVSSSSPPHAAATNASTAMKAAILMRCMFLLPSRSPPVADRSSTSHGRLLLSRSHRTRDGVRPRVHRGSPLPKDLLDAAGDPIARHEHPSDDDETEHDELE